MSRETTSCRMVRQSARNTRRSFTPLKGWFKLVIEGAQEAVSFEGTGRVVFDPEYDIPFSGEGGACRGSVGRVG